MVKIEWRRSEIEFIIDNYETMTTEELHKHLPNRSKKSINRKIEVLRDEGKIGHRNREAVQRAYYQRGRGKNRDTETNKPRKKGKIPLENYGYEDV